MNLPDKIFRNYDIRGIYPTDLDESGSYFIGKGISTFLQREKHIKSPKVVVGRDIRPSSEALSDSLIAGLVESGCSVVDVGVSLTPFIHYYTCARDFDFGVEVTASHNPVDYNGFRMDYRNARPFFGKDIEKLRDIVNAKNFVAQVGRITNEDMFPLYLDFIRQTFKFDKSVKIAIDCGYGTISGFVREIFEAVGADVVYDSCKIDPGFPRGTPDPESKSFIEALENWVVTSGADIGFVFDTDGDRVGVVDARGVSHETDKILLLFAKYYLTDDSPVNPLREDMSINDFKYCRTIAFDVKSSNLLQELILEYGGIPKRMKTGHPFFMDVVKNLAVMGAEYSGHIYFGRPYAAYDDGVFAACKLIELLMHLKKPLHELMDEFPKMYHTEELKFPCDDGAKAGIVEKMVKALIDQKDKFYDVDTSDGIRVSVSKYNWFLIRASNTAPYLSVRAEAEQEKDLKLILSGIADLFEEHKIAARKDFEKVQIYSAS